MIILSNTSMQDIDILNEKSLFLKILLKIFSRHKGNIPLLYKYFIYTSFVKFFFSSNSFSTSEIDLPKKE